MNLKEEITSELWNAVSSSYGSESYRHAVLDAFSQITRLLRDRTGLSGDGVSLVGAALGRGQGNRPNLQINRLQTPSERNAQDGLMNLLKGMYQGIRNPGTHETEEIDKKEADEIICFIGYLMGVLRESTPPFTVYNFVRLARDEYFKPSRRYASSLVDRLPPGKRLDALTALFRARVSEVRVSEWSSETVMVCPVKNLTLVSEAILKELDEEPVREFLTVVADELRVTIDEKRVHTALAMVISAKYWSKIDLLERQRIEYMVEKSVQAGKVRYNPHDGWVTRGELGTLVTDYFSWFGNENDIASILVEKLSGSDDDARRYVFCYFLGSLPGLVTDDNLVASCIKGIAASLRDLDTSERSKEARRVIDAIPCDWQHMLVEVMQDETDREHPLLWLSDGTPFLSEPSLEIDEGDIPF